MKTEGQIKQQVKQVVYRRRKAFIRHGLARHPENCTYTERVKLPIHMSNRATLHICGYCSDGKTPNNIVCDTSMGGDRQAAECPYFEARRSAEELKAEFIYELTKNGAEFAYDPIISYDENGAIPHAKTNNFKGII